MSDESPPPRFEFFSRKRRNSSDRIYYWRIRAANSRILCISQGYSRAIDRGKVAFHLRDGLIGARVYDMDADGAEVC